MLLPAMVEVCRIRDITKRPYPVSALAKVVGFAKKDIHKLETMQTVLASYLRGTAIGKRNAKNSQKRRIHDASSLYPDASAKASTSATSRPILSPTDLIQDLCIRLGSMIHDAEFAARYALKLFDTLVNSNGTMQRQPNTSKRRFSRQELRRDVKRHQEYYEAACFYLAVKKGEGGSSHLVKMPTKKKAKKESKSKHAKSDGSGKDGLEDKEEDNEDDDRPLKEIDVVRAANLLESTFKTVLACIRDWTELVTISLDNAGRGCRKEDTSGGTTTKTLFEVATKKDRTISHQETAPVDIRYEMWKEKVLNDAKMSVQAKMKEGDGRDWRTIAADEVLRKAGIR
mmetsp:Transcript_20648/g.49620  ORF Transcript_20648/g.49620 Transcript_20648/m.49620 type:complete len:342 (+) Transcript_20648:330-1355(+)